MAEATEVEAEYEVDDEQETAVAVRAPVAVSPYDADPEQFALALDRRKANRRVLMDWIKEALVEGTDFGRIHVVSKDKCPDGNRCKNPAHFSKPSLWKPGAEKILGMLGMIAEFPNLPAYEQRVIEGHEVKQIILKCQIVNGAGMVVGQGVGARSVQQDYGDLNKALKMAKKSGLIDATLQVGGLSEIFTQDIEDMPHFGQDEEADTFNPATVECPICHKTGNIIKGKEEYGGGFVCWKNAKRGKDGCSAKFAEDDARIIGEEAAQKILDGLLDNDCVAEEQREQTKERVKGDLKRLTDAIHFWKAQIPKLKAEKARDGAGPESSEAGEAGDAGTDGSAPATSDQVAALLKAAENAYISETTVVGHCREMGYVDAEHGEMNDLPAEHYDGLLEWIRAGGPKGAVPQETLPL